MPSIFGLGVSFLITLVTFVVVFVAAWQWWRGARGVTLVLTRFTIDSAPTATAPLEIVGRASGLIAWILTLLRVVAPVRLRVTQRDATVNWTSLSGVSQHYVPLYSVTHTDCGYRRSFLAFIIALAFTLGCAGQILAALLENNSNAANNDLISGVGALIVAAIAAVFYYRSKKIHIALKVPGGDVGLTFKSSVIGMVSVDLPEALKAIEVVNHWILANRVASKEKACAKCGSVNPPSAQFCDCCGAALGNQLTAGSGL